MSSTASNSGTMLTSVHENGQCSLILGVVGQDRLFQAQVSMNDTLQQSNNSDKIETFRRLENLGRHGTYF